MTHIEMVREFRVAFQLPLAVKGELPPLENRQVHHRLISEEFMELVHAKNRLEAFDALLDLRYVVLGACLEYISDWHNPLWTTNSPLDILVLNEVLLWEEELYEAQADLEALMSRILAHVQCWSFNPIQWEAGFAEVHRSNMSKMWTDEEKRSFPVIHEVFYHTNAGPRPWVVKRDGKVIKSPSYSPANLQPILEAR